jgi:uncharacterized membrane protein
VRTFAILALLFGVLFAFAVPPTLNWDEEVHFYRAYDVSEGQLLPAIKPQTQDGWCSGLLPAGIVKVGKSFQYLYRAEEKKLRVRDLMQMALVPLEADRRVPALYFGTGCYHFVPYLPSAAGIWLARHAGLGPLAMFYAGRLANLACATGLVCLAIWITPIFKRLFAALALMPITLGLFASFSADTLTIATSFLLIAIFFHLSLARGSRARPGPLAGLHVSGLILGLCKFPYTPLALLYLAIPRERIGSWRRYLLVGGTLAVITALPAYIWLQRARIHHPQTHSVPGYHCAPEEQMRYLARHPWTFFPTIVTTCVNSGERWINGSALPGEIVTRRGVCHFLAFKVFFAFLILLAILDRSREGLPSGRMKSLAIAAALASAGLIFFSLYSYWSQVGGHEINGIQGRYFIPLLPLILLLCQDRLMRIEIDAGFLRTLTFSACSAILFIAVEAYLYRYYEKGSFWGVMPPRWSVSLACGAMVLVWLSRPILARVDHKRTLFNAVNRRAGYEQVSLIPTPFEVLR